MTVSDQLSSHAQAPTIDPFLRKGPARQDAHRLRAESQAVLVGKDPKKHGPRQDFGNNCLTCRMQIASRA